MKQLTDSFGRIHDYLRISLTDRCNMQCQYCVPHGDFKAISENAKMNSEELLAIAGKFIERGIKKIRLTGGEPLLRKDFREILQKLSQKNVELAISTNGLLLHQFADDLWQAGLKKVNISLDSLNADAFKQITVTGKLDQVLKNIELCLEKGFEIKINAVAIKGVNEEELIQLARLTLNQSLTVRFIEFMPFHKNEWKISNLIGLKEILALLQSEFQLEKLEDGSNDTDKKYKIKGAKGSLGIISTITQPFCEGCNRLRLTSDGKIKNCLFGREELDLLGEHRKGDDVGSLIEQSLAAKHARTGGLNLHDQAAARSMVSIGG